MGRLVLRSSNTTVDTGLQFLANGAANSAIRLEWSGATMPSRTARTFIYRKLYFEQVGYYCDDFYTGGTWLGSQWEFGVHGHPCDGTYETNGQRSVATGGSGTVQYFEIAGLTAGDFIAKPMEPAFCVNDPGDPTSPAQAGTWLTHVFTIELINAGTDVRHRAWPDFDNAPANYIEQTVTNASLSAPASPKWIIGSPPWRDDQPTSGRSDETPYGVLRGFRSFDVCLSTADITSEIAAIGNNTPATAAGSTNVHYINDNPTPDDVSDKSGAGNDPTWGTANRPTLWTA